MRFDWNAAKAASNLRKHGVSFEEAETMFVAAEIFEDLEHSEDEDRYIAIGFSVKHRLLSVAFTMPEPDVCRIISARKATRREREMYEEAKRQNP